MLSVRRRGDTARVFEVLEGPWRVNPKSPSGQDLGELHAWVESSTPSQSGEVTSEEVVARLVGTAVRWLGPGVSWEVSSLDAFAASYSRHRKATITVGGELPEGANPKAHKPYHEIYGTKVGDFHEEGWYQVVETHKDAHGADVTTTAWLHLRKPLVGHWRETLYFPADFNWVDIGVTWKITWYDATEHDPDTSMMRSMAAVIDLK